jgi:Calpain family cysteine protease
MSSRPTARSVVCSSRSFVRYARFGLVCGALAAFHPGLAAAQSDSPPAAVTLAMPAQQFLAAVRANFAAWDLDHDGRLSREEIELDMQNPRIGGDAAAALAALKLGATHSNHLQDTRSYALTDFDAMEQSLQAGQKLAPNFVGYFTAGRKKLKEVPRQLFADGIPHLAAMRQDWTSDCYFMSATGALAEADPQAIVRLVASNSDGTFTVSFPGKTAVRLPAPTETEIATYSNAKDGLWLSLLEKAFAVLRIKAEPAQASTREPLDSVGFRTGSSNVMELLTGHASKFVRFPAPNGQPADARLVQQIRGELQTALREHRVVESQKAAHDYAVVAYDPAADTVTLHNPYDRGGFETWPDGGKGARTDDGFFTLPTAQWVSYFVNVRFELGGRVS